jgi:hypothetical protein
MQTLTKAVFDISDQFGGVIGIHNPDNNWNGFAMPFFPMQSVLILQNVTNLWAATDMDSSVVITVDDDGVWELDTDNLDEMPDARGYLVGNITVDGVTYYAVGDSWAWEVIDQTTDMCCDCGDNFPLNDLVDMTRPGIDPAFVMVCKGCSNA